MEDTQFCQVTRVLKRSFQLPQDWVYQEHVVKTSQTEYPWSMNLEPCYENELRMGGKGKGGN